MRQEERKEPVYNINANGDGCGWREEGIRIVEGVCAGSACLSCRMVMRDVMLWQEIN